MGVTTELMEMKRSPRVKRIHEYSSNDLLMRTEKKLRQKLRQDALERLEDFDTAMEEGTKLDRLDDALVTLLRLDAALAVVLDAYDRVDPIGAGSLIEELRLEDYRNLSPWPLETAEAQQ